MKSKHILVLSFILITTIPLSAQYLGSEHLFQCGAGIGLSGAYDKAIDFDFEQAPPWVFRLGYEYMFDNIVSLGVITAYGFNENFEHTYQYYYDINGYHAISTYRKETYDYYIIAFRMNFHFYSDENLDFYFGGTIGGNYIDKGGYYSESHTDGKYIHYEISDTEIKIYYGAHFGMQVFFTRNFGMFSEVGYDVGLLALGFTVKL
jgi:hypothetical protein